MIIVRLFHGPARSSSQRSVDHYELLNDNVKHGNLTAQPHSSQVSMMDSAQVFLKAGVYLRKVNLGIALRSRSHETEHRKAFECDANNAVNGRCIDHSTFSFPRDLLQTSHRQFRWHVVWL